jgi:hypothetical protein
VSTDVLLNGLVLRWLAIFLPEAGPVHSTLGPRQRVTDLNLRSHVDFGDATHPVSSWGGGHGARRHASRITAAPGEAFSSLGITWAPFSFAVFVCGPVVLGLGVIHFFFQVNDLKTAHNQQWLF